VEAGEVVTPLEQPEPGEYGYEEPALHREHLTIDAKDAITRIQNIRDETALAQVRWYVEYCIGLDATGKTYDELDALRTEDDWASYNGYEAAETEENFCGQIDAFNRVLDVLQILAHGGTPEQGS
jgi:hypothetical protein